MGNIAFELDHEQEPVARIKVVGAGGAGGNAIRRMIDSGLSRVEFIAVNTDEQVLHKSSATTQICVGSTVTRGLGAGGRPEIGRQAVEEDRERVASALAGADMVFITAGMGGGTGTGSSPIIAELAREIGALTVGVVTTPFLFEGRKRISRAQDGLRELRENVDTLIVISNQRLLQVLPGKTPINEAFREADNVLRQAVQGITDIILVPGLVNLDFADVRTVMSHRGNATMGTGIGTGNDRARRAAQEAISSPLLEDVSIGGAKGVLVNISAGPALSQDDISEVMEVINGAAGDESDTYFGVVLDDTMPEDEIRITLIATGFENGSVDDVETPVAKPDTRQPKQEQSIRQSDRPASPPVSRIGDITSIPAFQRRVAIEKENKEATPPSETPEEAEVSADEAALPTDDIRVPTFIRKARRRR